MTPPTDSSTERRTPLSRDRVLRAAVNLADRGGIESLSMRKLGQELGVEAMSLYKHVANKEDILDGMVDAIVSEIKVSSADGDWLTAMRDQIMSARDVMQHHPWASGVIESRTVITPTMMTYMDSVVGIMRDGGFSLDLIHHAMHALGSRLLGFSQQLFDDSDDADMTPEAKAAMLTQFPNISAMLDEITHEEGTVVGKGCDDRIEFVFGLDLILNGLESKRSTD
jgi:AcrR family transcriptional regulator